MTRPARFTQADVERAIRAALRAGLKPGEFDVIREGDKLSVLTHPASAALPSGGDDAWAGAMQKWRRSA